MERFRRVVGRVAQSV